MPRHRGVEFHVGPRTPCPGVGWSIPTYDHFGRRTGTIESQGAFYDDHPLGACGAANVACRRFIEKNLAPTGADEEVTA